MRRWCTVSIIDVASAESFDGPVKVLPRNPEFLPPWNSARETETRVSGGSDRVRCQRRRIQQLSRHPQSHWTILAQKALHFREEMLPRKSEVHMLPDDRTLRSPVGASSVAGSFFPNQALVLAIRVLPPTCGRKKSGGAAVIKRWNRPILACLMVLLLGLFFYSVPANADPGALPRISAAAGCSSGNHRSSPTKPSRDYPHRSPV